jgi:hypothetical protein
VVVCFQCQFLVFLFKCYLLCLDLADVWSLRFVDCRDECYFLQDVAYLQRRPNITYVADIQSWGYPAHMANAWFVCIDGRDECLIDQDVAHVPLRLMVLVSHG